MQIRLPNLRRSVDQCLADQSIRLREEARTMPPGVERDRLIRMARRAETAARVNAWVESRGLQSPK